MNIESVGFNRTKAPELLSHLRGGRSFILFGPRQTGKTTLLEGIFAGLPPQRCLRYDFQLPTQRSRIEGDPEILAREIEAIRGKGPVYLFIDEIQKVPRVTDVLQYLIDKKKIILAATGSSARKMRKVGTNWLPGRIRLEHLYPLVWEETGFPPARLPEVLRYGSLPGILAKKAETERDADLAAYTHLYLEEEIRMEAVVRNIPRFEKFLRLASLESGSSPNLSKIGGQVGLSHTSIREYFRILEDTLIIHRLDAYGSSRNSILRGSKYYFFDLGVRNAAARIGHSEGILTLQRGLLFEHFVVLELLARMRDRAKVSYWRSQEGEEVDLIVDDGKRVVAVEVKATTRPSQEDFRGLAAFGKKYRPKETTLVCQADRAQKFGAFLALPWQEFLKRFNSP